MASYQSDVVFTRIGSFYGFLRRLASFRAEHTFESVADLRRRAVTRCKSSG